MNRYPVYNADIKPLGFEFIELDGFVDDQCVEDVKQLLEQPDTVREMTETNYEIAGKHFSYKVLETKLIELLDSF